jgi:hypothetical protein
MQMHGETRHTALLQPWGSRILVKVLLDAGTGSYRTKSKLLRLPQHATSRGRPESVMCEVGGSRGRFAGWAKDMSFPSEIVSCSTSKRKR